jgi:hypothetical protein
LRSDWMQVVRGVAIYAVTVGQMLWWVRRHRQGWKSRTAIVGTPASIVALVKRSEGSRGREATGTTSGDGRVLGWRRNGQRHRTDADC